MKDRYTLADVLMALREQYRTGDVFGSSGKPYVNRTELFGDVADMWCLPLDNLEKQDSKTNEDSPQQAMGVSKGSGLCTTTKQASGNRTLQGTDWLYGLFVHEFSNN